MNEMRSCGAAIIHVDDERHITDKDDAEYIVLNDNVFIEIGAAMAIYGERFILIVKEGLKLPSNLTGLLELRYKGNTPQIEDTIKLIDAINDMKKHFVPLAPERTDRAQTLISVDASGGVRSDS